MSSTRIGAFVFYRNQGQAWAEMFRGSMTASGFVTAGAAWLGMSKAHAIVLGIGSIFFWVGLAVLFGWAVVKWKVYHAQTATERDANPITTETLHLLRTIESNTRSPLALMGERAYASERRDVWDRIDSQVKLGW